MAKKFLLLILLADGLIWLRSSYGKFSAGTFVETLGKTLEKFASQDPYSWYKGLLQDVAIPNAPVVGTVILWGELLVALAIVVGAVLLWGKRAGARAKWILLAGLLGGAVLNLLFWLAAGWTSPSTDSLNLLMMVVELVGAFFIWRS